MCKTVVTTKKAYPGRTTGDAVFEKRRGSVSSSCL